MSARCSRESRATRSSNFSGSHEWRVSQSMNQVAEAHRLLELLRKRRGDNKAVIDAPTKLLTLLDALYDRKARGFYRLLFGYIEALDDAELADLCRTLLDMCFPNDLEVVNAWYIDEAGWVRA